MGLWIFPSVFLKALGLLENIYQSVFYLIRSESLECDMRGPLAALAFTPDLIDVGRYVAVLSFEGRPYRHSLELY